MVSKAYEQLRMSSTQELFETLVKDLVGDGQISSLQKFELVEPSLVGSLGGVTSALMRATSKIDPKIGATPSAEDLIWGISVYIENDQVKMSWGRMRYDGAQGLNTELFVGQSPHAYLGNIAELTAPGGTAATVRTKAIGPSNLHGYNLTVTDYGFSLGVYHQNKIKNWTQFSALTLQRPKKSDGTVLLDKKAPLFVVWNNLDYGVTGNTSAIGPEDDLSPRWYKSVLMEDDVPHSVGSLTFNPTIYQGPTAASYQVDKRPSTFRQVHVEGPNTLYAFPSDWPQPLTQDNNEVALVFPFGLCTDRFAYLEELDLLCVGPSCVFTFGQIIDLVVFGESRQYQILSSSDPCGGVVVAIQIDGPDFV